jgi:hypothetical protein
MDKRNKAQIFSILQPDDSKAVRFANSEKYPEAKGTLFKKRIINYGEYADQWFPDLFFKLDAEWGSQVLQNFKDKTVGRVYVPASHTDDPEKNRGEVIDMFESADGKGIDAILDIREAETVKAIEAELIWDVSIGFTMNWISKEGEEKGPAIYHVALVNNPYIEDMPPFEAFAKITEVCRAELASAYQANAIMLSRTSIRKELDAMGKVKVTNDKDHEVKVTITEDGEEKELVIAAGAEVEVPEDQKEAVEKAIADSTPPADEDADDDAGDDTGDDNGDDDQGDDDDSSDDDDSDDDEELDESEKAELARLRSEKVERDADTAYNKLLNEGKLVPAQEKAFKAAYAARHLSHTFSVKDGKTEQKTVGELMDELFAHAQPVVKFSESGNNGSGNNKDNETPYDRLSDEAKAGLQATKVSKEKYNEAVEKHPELYGNSNDKKEDEE